MHSSNNTDIQTHETSEINMKYVIFISVIAALGGLLFGYDWVVIGGAKPFYEDYFNLKSVADIGWANSCALLGCLLGSIISGLLSDKFGRKKLLILSAFLFAISSILTGLANNFDIFIFWRIIGGVAIGMASIVSPTYIAEVAPANWRGRLVTLNQLAIVIGVLAAQIVNLFIADNSLEWSVQTGWRYMFIAVAIPSVIFLIFAFLVPESPRWLIKMQKFDAAHKILNKIGGNEYANNELSFAKNNLEKETEKQSINWKEILKPNIIVLLFIGIFLAILQQWSGTNVIFNYAEEIYRGAGYDLSGIMFNIVITGAINLIFTLVALAYIDKFGRRALMLIGALGIGILHLCLGSAYYFDIQGPVVLLLTLAVIAFYAMSLAPVTWVLLSEIFPNKIRGLAMSISVSALWIASFGVTFTFPMLNERLGAAGTFGLYGIICLVGFAFILKFIPETKGKSLEEIETIFETNNEKVENV